MSVMVFEKFISKSECNELNEWVQQGPLKGKLVPGPDGTNLTDYSLTTNTRISTRRTPRSSITYPPLVFSIQKKITEMCNLHNLEFSKNGGLDGIIVNCTKPGGDIWEHVDPTENFLEDPAKAAISSTLHMLRCNIITQRPEQGGELFIHNEKIDLDVGDLHCYLVTKHPHYVTENKGTIDRICWLFGYQIPTSDPRFLQWV